VDLCICMHGSNKECKNTWKEHEDRCVVVIENHMLDGTGAITMMNHKHTYVVLVNNTGMDSINIVVIECCNDFQVDQFIKCILQLLRFISCV